jgi:hypothetical protein
MNLKKAKAIRAALAPRDKLSDLATEETRRVSRGAFFRVTTGYKTMPGTERRKEFDMLIDLKVVPRFGTKQTLTTSTQLVDPASPRGVYLAVKRLAA